MKFLLPIKDQGWPGGSLYALVAPLIKFLRKVFRDLDVLLMLPYNNNSFKQQFESTLLALAV